MLIWPRSLRSDVMPMRYNACHVQPPGSRNVLLVLKADVLFALHMMLLYAGTTMPEQVRIESCRRTNWRSVRTDAGAASGARAVGGGCGDCGDGVVCR